MYEEQQVPVKIKNENGCIVIDIVWRPNSKTDLLVAVQCEEGGQLLKCDWKTTVCLSTSH